MPEMPANTLLGYIGTVFFLFGALLVLIGLGVIKVQQITVSGGGKTLISGIVVATIGVVLIFSDMNNGVMDVLSIDANSVVAENNSVVSVTATVSSNSYFLADGREVLNIKRGDEVAAMHGEITISLDHALGSSNLGISVRAPGYVKQDFQQLAVGDEVLFDGDASFRILIADYRVISGFISDYEIQVVVTKLNPEELETGSTQEPVVQEIVKLKAGEEISVFGGEIFIEYEKYAKGLLSYHVVKVRSDGYVSQSYTLNRGSKVKFLGKYTYTIVLTDYDSDSGYLHLVVSK